MIEILNVLTPVLPILGIVTGASIQSYYAKKAENKKQVLMSKTNAYVDYLECVSQSAHMDRSSKNELALLLSRTVSSKSKICVYGSKEVILALARFEETGANMGSKENAEIFINLCSAMRKDHMDENTEELLEEMNVILLGKGRW
ncbi:MAG: hypothetical protein V3U75_09110 [Methylococcaceae bacterium]